MTRRNYRRLSEAGFQGQVTQLMTITGWAWYHTHDSRGSNRGFPDIVAVKDRVIYAELKRSGEEPRPDQLEWHDRLLSARAEAYFWWPEDLDAIRRILSPHQHARP